MSVKEKAGVNLSGVGQGATVTTINISIPAIEEALSKLEATEEGPILAQYIDYLQALLKSTVISIFPYERS